MGLERHNPGIPQRDLLLIDVVKLILQPFGHLVKGLHQVLKLQIFRFLLNLIAKISRLNLIGSLHHVRNRLRDIPVEYAKQNQKQRHQEQKHACDNERIAIKRRLNNPFIRLHHHRQGEILFLLRVINVEISVFAAVSRLPCGGAAFFYHLFDISALQQNGLAVEADEDILPLRGIDEGAKTV